MLWECDGAAVEMVTFRYPEAPGDYISVSERGVCDQLRGSGQKTATVVFEVWGWPGRLRGYRIEKINGTPFRGGEPGLGVAGSFMGPNDPPRRHPLEDALR